MNFGDYGYIAASDFLSNIFLFKDGQLYKTYLNAHSRLITDIVWIFTFDEKAFGENSREHPVPGFASCSMDGALRLWSLDD